VIEGRRRPARWLVVLVAALAFVLGISNSALARTTSTDPGSYTYDGQAAARVESHVSTHALVGPAYLIGAMEWSASPPAAARGTSTTVDPARNATEAGASGPVRFRPPPGATADEIAQVRAYVDGCNRALCAGQLSPTGRVSTQGALRADASRAAAAERARAAASGTPYQGHAGHVPDTTWTGSATPPQWMDLSPRVNTSLGGQAVQYPPGYQPAVFEFVDG
jgi:hypothetical protein